MEQEAFIKLVLDAGYAAVDGNFTEFVKVEKAPVYGDVKHLIEIDKGTVSYSAMVVNSNEFLKFEMFPAEKPNSKSLKWHYLNRVPLERFESDGWLFESKS